MAHDKSSRHAACAPSAACRARSGIVAVATDTPKMPIGMYISRNAYRSADAAPSTRRREPRVDQQIDLRGRDADRAGTHQDEHFDATPGRGGLRIHWCR